MYWRYCIVGLGIIVALIMVNTSAAIQNANPAVSAAATVTTVALAAAVPPPPMFIDERLSIEWNPAHECVWCHDVHGGINFVAKDPYEALCISCHGPGGSSGKEAAAHSNRDNSQYDPFRMSCLNCHNPHTDPDNWMGGVNLKLVGKHIGDDYPWVAELETPNSGTRYVTYESRGTGSGDPTLHSFADSDEDGNAYYDGICETCHTQTKYHRNSEDDPGHYIGATCTSCHPHKDGFKPTGGDCVDCHSNPQDNGDNVPPGGRRAVVDEFGKFSHHVYSDQIKPEDCTTCHNMDQHQSGYVRLQDPDYEPIVYNYDTMSEADLENFCINCHDADGTLVGNGIIPFSDGRTVPDIAGDPGSMWDDSAHKSQNKLCGDCHSEVIHGSDNLKLLKENSVDTLCYNCHYDPGSGGIENLALSGADVADDILQAFSMGEKHNLGTSFDLNDDTFTIQCTTCHNPHVVTGKHWDVEFDVSPVTRPDFSDSINNPRAMGRTLWGAVPGQKIDDFAAMASGTGGWYFNVLRGLTYDTESIPFDQPAKYQPPKKGSGYDWEFAGDVLPDYVTLCLDCHTNRMNTHPPVNWGQGVECTDNSVDPPDQRVECGAQHGLNVGAKPYIWDPNNGMYGAGGNPDPIFTQDGVKRGRGAGQWTRWPYEPADRNAGINYVLSCTDCHEAHGSPIGSMLRTTVNNKPGSTTWNTMCNACHYYYGYQHAGMSCGNASCHEANSIHRIIHVTSSGGVHLWMPPEVPEITDVITGFGRTDLVVTFSEAVYADIDQSGSLTTDDFIFTDNDDGRYIVDVYHYPGDLEAIVTLSAPIDMDNDVDVDTLSAAPAAVFDDLGIPSAATPFTIRGDNCPPDNSTAFQLNEPAGSLTVQGDWGLITGTVSDPDDSLAGDGLFYGDGLDNYIDFFDNDKCLSATTTLDLQARFMPTIVDDGDGKLIQRIFVKNGSNYQTSVWRNNDWDTYNAPDGVASIALWVRVLDAHGGYNWKPVLTDYDNYPIVANHWYEMTITWDSAKIGGIPGDIYIDDQGIDGFDTDELWAGYVNCTDSDQSLLGENHKLLEGDEILSGSGSIYIGTPGSYNTSLMFNGWIDWISISTGN